MIICHYCEEEIEKERVTKDHVVPKQKIRQLISRNEGFSNHLDLEKNIVLACFHCNFNKGNKDYNSFKMLGVATIRHLKKLLINKQLKATPIKKKKYKRKKFN